VQTEQKIYALLHAVPSSNQLLMQHSGILNTLM